MADPTKNMGRVTGLLEEANQFLWDSDQIASTTTSLTMFQTVQSGSKSKLLTNMTQSGVLPVPKMMKVKALRFILAAACTVADAKLILDGTYLEFWVNDKIMLDGPVFMFHQGVGVDAVAMSTANDVTYQSARNGSISSRDIFTVRHSIDIGVQTPFFVKVLLPSALSGLGATTRFWTTLEGDQWRGIS